MNLSLATAAVHCCRNDNVKNIHGTGDQISMIFLFSFSGFKLGNFALKSCLSLMSTKAVDLFIQVVIYLIYTDQLNMKILMDRSSGIFANSNISNATKIKLKEKKKSKNRQKFDASPIAIPRKPSPVYIS